MLLALPVDRLVVVVAEFQIGAPLPEGITLLKKPATVWSNLLKSGWCKVGPGGTAECRRKNVHLPQLRNKD